MKTTLIATRNTSKLEKIHPFYLSNKTWKWWKVCVDRPTFPNVNNTFSEEWRWSWWRFDRNLVFVYPTFSIRYDNSCTDCWNFKL